MRVFRQLLGLLFLVVISGALHAANDPAWLEEFRKFAQQQMQEDQIPGMTIGLTRWETDTDTIWVEGFGYSDLENKIPAKPESAFRLGSVSKPMTAAAVLLLVERGKIDLDAEVQTYVPYFPKKKWPVTVRQLLGHLGGISHYKNYDVEGRIKEHKNSREAIAIFQDWDLVAEPGTKYSYSSYGYNLLAAVVEGASGVPFGEFLKQNVWDPLGMRDTRLDDPADLISNRVRGYRILQGQIKNSEFVDISSRFGAGGTRSTVPDLLKFARGIAQGTILSGANLNLVYSSMATRDGTLTNYSAGWSTRPANGHFIVSHTGSQQETATALFCFPALKLAIACAINQEDAGASIFVRRLFELMTGERWNLTAYVTSQQDTYRVIDSVFSYGMSYFQRQSQTSTLKPEEIKLAFDDLRKTLTSSNGSGTHLTQAGFYMAKTLFEQKGPAKLKGYHSSGSIAFFEDYLMICELERRKDAACTFPKPFRKLISSWYKDWSQTNSEEIRRLRVNPHSSLDQVGPLLRTAFQQASAYPDYSREFGDLVWEFLLKGEDEKSIRAGEIGASLYPDSARLVALYGISLAATSDKTRGVVYLKKAYQLDPKSPAEPDWLNDFAEELANFGRVQEASRVIEAGLVLHPEDANLKKKLEALAPPHK